MFTLYYDNRRLLALTILLIVVAGLSAYMVLPRLEDPVLNERVAFINTVFPGASAERVEALVTEKIEAELMEIEETKELRSHSFQGISTITLEIHDWVQDTDEVWSRVRDKLADAEKQLPVEAQKPNFVAIEPQAYGLIVAITWDGEKDPNYAIMRRHAEDLEDQLRAVVGTEDVVLHGCPQEEITVEIDPTQLAAIGLTSEEVAQQILKSDTKIASGQLHGKQRDILLEVAGELDSLERIAGIPIKSSDAVHLRLDQIARINKGIKQPALDLAVIDGKPAVVLGVLPRDDRRIDVWSADVREKVASFAATLPRGLSMVSVFEQSQYVEARLTSLLWNLCIGAAAVVLVVLLLMGWRNALVVGLSLPLASLMVLTGMHWLSVPIHQMSVTGLIIALGLLIDNAIVVVDDVQTRLSEGETPRNAVSKCVKHLAVPLFGSTLTTCLAFAPIALMAGPSGEFVSAIAVSVMLAVGSSFFLAMTVIPAVAALVRRAATATSNRWWENGFSSATLTATYRSFLNFLFRRPALGMILGLALPIAGFCVATQLRSQFFPPTERDHFQLELQLPRHASMEQTLRFAVRAREMLLNDANIEGVDWFLGSSAPSFYYNIVPRQQDSRSYAHGIVHLKEGVKAGPVVRRTQELLDLKLPEARSLARQLEQGPPFNAPVEIRILGPDTAELRRLGDEMRTILSTSPLVTHTADTLSEPEPKLVVDVDEEKARRAGLSLRDIASQLDGTLEGVIAGNVLESTEEVPIRVRVADANRDDLASIASLDMLPMGSRTLKSRVPLTAVAKLNFQPQDSAITRFNNRRMNEVQAFVVAGVLPSEVLSDFQRKLSASGFKLPAGYSMEFGGEAAKRDDAVGNLMASAGVLVVIMIATLVLSFGSFRMAGLIGLVAVQSLGLGMLSLWLFGYPFGFMAILGTMGLVGVAINDSIVVLAAIRAETKERDANRSTDDATGITGITDVVVRSTRHVLATTLTTVAGFLPLILAGDGFWPPLAICIAGGVCGATILALVFVPSAYLILQSNRMTVAARNRRQLRETAMNLGFGNAMHQPN